MLNNTINEYIWSAINAYIHIYLIHRIIIRASLGFGLVSYCAEWDLQLFVLACDSRFEMLLAILSLKSFSDMFFFLAYIWFSQRWRHVHIFWIPFSSIATRSNFQFKSTIFSFGSGVQPARFVPGNSPEKSCWTDKPGLTRIIVGPVIG